MFIGGWMCVIASIFEPIWYTKVHSVCGRLVDFFIVSVSKKTFKLIRRFNHSIWRSIESVYYFWIHVFLYVHRTSFHLLLVFCLVLYLNTYHITWPWSLFISMCFYWLSKASSINRAPCWKQSNSMYTHTYIRSVIRMNDTILSTRTARAQHSTRTSPSVTDTTAATNTNTCFAPILSSLII